MKIATHHRKSIIQEMFRENQNAIRKLSEHFEQTNTRHRKIDKYVLHN